MTAAATWADRIAGRVRALRGDDPNPPGGGARLARPVVVVDEMYARSCAGYHRPGSVVRPTRACLAGCGRAFCGSHADRSRGYRCRGCGGETVLIADATVLARDGREMGWAA